ncbi:MAG TPA: S9 family peptidase [Terriglobales bacterium]|nr:S9 family peptidase [Terriglobales bacterium]
MIGSCGSAGFVRRNERSAILALLAGVCLWHGAASLFARAPVKRPLAPADVYRLKEVAGPQVSPDGRWIAYTVTALDREADKLRTAVWMVNWEGTQDLRLTNGPESETTPRWSPDGRFLAFLSARSADGKTQVWLLDRRGGEASPLTDVKGDIGGYEWSPDGKRLVLAMQDSEESPGAEGDAKAKAAKPIVIDRYHFKRDYEGYLTALSHAHLYLFDVGSRKLGRLTEDKGLDEGDAAWSPDGSEIAFVGREPDRAGTDDLFVVEARPGAAPRKLLTFNAPDAQRLLWSPDGRTIAFAHGLEPKYQGYNQDRLAVVPAAGGEPRDLAAALDRRVTKAEFLPDGASLAFIVEDDRRAYLAKTAAGGGAVERMTDGAAVPSDHVSRGGRTVVAASTDSSATEVYAVENGALRRLTSHNDALLAEVKLGAVEDTSFRSKDGTEVHGLVVKPPSCEAGKAYPTLVWIHGGPCMQDDHALLFDLYPLQFERQLFAAHGYVVLAINYRGSSGRGAAFAKSIFADWGNREVADILAGVDDAVRKGIADPGRLGIGGWSYGGISTDYTIATDPRFKAAVSGAGSALQLSMFGGDQYVHQYIGELGPPWRNPDVWLKVSYAFFHADRIRTPTLFMGGEKDFNVPIIGSEQMYQALRSLGVPTELVIYPGQHHVLTRPSYIHDHLERILAWFDKYLKGAK